MSIDTNADTVTDVLRRFLADTESVDAAAVRCALDLTSSTATSTEWSSHLAEEARAVYNFCLELDAGGGRVDDNITRTGTLVRTLCLTLVEAGSTGHVRDMDKANTARHW